MMRHRDAWAEQQRAPSREHEAGHERLGEAPAMPAAPQGDRESDSGSGSAPERKSRTSQLVVGREPTAAGESPNRRVLEHPVATNQELTVLHGVTGLEASDSDSGLVAANPSGEPRQPELVSSRRIVPTATDQSEATEVDDILIVVSKLKKYVRLRSGMSTSDGVMGTLSEHLRRLCDEAIRNAARDGRKTVMDRDFWPLLRRDFHLGR